MPRLLRASSHTCATWTSSCENLASAGRSCWCSPTAAPFQSTRSRLGRSIAAERTGRRCRRAELLPPCDRWLGHCAGGCRQSHLDGDRRHLVRRHADVARRGGDEGRPDDRRLSRLDPVDRHPHHWGGRRNHCRRRSRWHALRRPTGGGRPSGAGVLWPWRHRADCHRCAARARPAASRRLCRLRPDSRPGRGPQGHRNAASPSRSACRSRMRRPASLRCSSRTCCTPSNTSPSSEGMRRAGLLWSRRAAQAPCMAPTSRAGSGAGGSTCPAMPAPCARSGCCTRTSDRIFRPTSRASWTSSSRAMSTASWPSWPIRHMRRYRSEGFAPDQVDLERAIDLHYRGQLWSNSCAPDKGSVQPSRDPARLRGGVSAPLWSHSAGWRDHGCIVACRGASCDGDAQGPTNRSERSQECRQAPHFPISLARQASLARNRRLRRLRPRRG